MYSWRRGSFDKAESDRDEKVFTSKAATRGRDGCASTIVCRFKTNTHRAIGGVRLGWLIALDVADENFSEQFEKQIKRDRIELADFG